MSSLIKLRFIHAVFLGFAVFLSHLLYAQCSTANPAGCSCPTPGATNCLLLPDITAGKSSLNATTGWTEYTQAAASPNKGLLRLDVSTPNIGWGPIETVSTNNYLCGTGCRLDGVSPCTWTHTY